jgi:hypothetical protein
LVVREDAEIRAAGEAEDQVLEGAEPAGEAAGVFRGSGAPVEVRGEPGAGECPVAGEQVFQDGRFQGGLAG